MSIPAILQDADRALSEALSDDPAQRLEAMKRFMRSFYDIAKEIHAGNGSWDDVRPWAREVADRVWAAHTALGGWQSDLGHLLYDRPWGEESMELALERRSQHAFAREAFQGTEIDDVLAGSEDAEVDQDLRNGAVRYALDAEPFVPASHTWWRNRPA